MIINYCEQQSEAWHQARLGRITGTRFKNLMSKESTASYQDLITDLACEIITGKAEDTYINDLMQHGIDTEPVARKEYEAIFGIEVKQAGFIIPDEDHPYYDWIGISPDGIVDEGMIEIKCPKMSTHLEYIECGSLPYEYKYQVQGQLFVTGFKYCDFMSFVEGMKPFIIRIYPDAELFKEFDLKLSILIPKVKAKIEKYNQYDYLT